MESIRQYLAEHAYFRGLSPSDLEHVARLATLRTLARGEILALEGDECRAVYLIVQGRVQALKMSPQGREQIVSEMRPGASFYIVPALDGGPLPATTRAATRATLISFTCQGWRDLLRCYPSVAMQVLVDFARRLRHLTSLVEDLSLRSVPQRLARMLLERAQSTGDRQTTQREMAAQLGTVREVVARTLNQFERQGIIHLRRGVIEIVNLTALRKLASGE